MKKKQADTHTAVDWAQLMSYQQLWVTHWMNMMQQAVSYQQQSAACGNLQNQVELGQLQWMEEIANQWSKTIQDGLNTSFQQFFDFQRKSGYYTDAVTKMAGVNTLKEHTIAF